MKPYSQIASPTAQEICFVSGQHFSRADKHSLVILSEARTAANTVSGQVERAAKDLVVGFDESRALTGAGYN